MEACLLWCNKQPVLFSARGTETVAVEQPDGSYKLYGYKWFSSATDADVSLTLARVVGKDGSMVEVMNSENENFILFFVCL